MCRFVLDGKNGTCYTLYINERQPQYLPLIKYGLPAYTFKKVGMRDE